MGPLLYERGYQPDEVSIKSHSSSLLMPHREAFYMFFVCTRKSGPIIAAVIRRRRPVLYLIVSIYQRSRTGSVGDVLNIIELCPELTSQHHIRSRGIHSFFSCLSYIPNMISFPSRTRQSPQGSFQSLSGLSTPVSRGQSPLHSPSQSASSSTYFLNHNQESTTILPQIPPPTFFRHSTASSVTSIYEDYDGSTTCATPNPERDFGFGAASKSVTSFEKSLDPTSYTIETLHQHDDADLLTPWRRKLYRLSPLFTFLAVSAYFLYYGYRIHCTVYAQRAYHKTYIMAWLFIAAEGCVACKRSTFETDPHLTHLRSRTSASTLPNAFHSRPPSPKTSPSRRFRSNCRYLRYLLQRRCRYRAGHYSRRLCR